MRALAFPALALMTLIASPSAYAQAPKAPSGGDTTRYFTFDSGLMDDLQVDGILTETRQAGRLVSATLDVCYPGTSDNRDRFVVTLTPDRGRLVGSTKSQEEKEQVTVNLLRRQTGTTYSFEGTIKVGSDQMKVASNDNTELTEKDYREGLPEQTKIVAKPADFTELSPDSVGIRVKRQSLADLMKKLKGQDASVDMAGLEPDCAVLRTGENVVLIQIHPDRAAALIEQVKGLPGVTAAGYSPGIYSMDLAVRIAAADFRQDGTIDTAKLAAAIGASAEKALSAKLRSTAWDKTTGEFTLELARPSEVVAGFELTELLRVKGVVGPEKPAGTDNLIIWLGDATTEIVDPGPEPRLKFTAAAAADDDAQNKESDELVTKLAEDLKGKTWDAEGMAWK